VFERLRAIFNRRRLRPLSDWYFVTFDEQVVRVQAQPPGRPAWSQEFRWDSVVRVCFMAEEDMWVSDGIYVFTADRPESYAIPTEASGGTELWREILRRKLFDAELAIETAASDGVLSCWPAEGQHPKT
jgi:hypothetical protein